MNSFLKEMIDHYGAPDWDKGGRNPKTIEREYDDILKGFVPDQLKALAKDCIKSCERFPSVASVCKVIEKTGYKAPTKSQAEGTNAGYEGFCKWYHSTRKRYSHVMPIKFNGILSEHYHAYAKLKDATGAPKERIYGGMYADGWLTQIENRLREKNESNDKEFREWLNTGQGNTPEKFSLGSALRRVLG